MRDIAGFVETRAAMLQMKPSNKGHWITFAVAHHLNGDHQLAAQALQTYEKMQVTSENMALNLFLEVHKVMLRSYCC